MSIVLLPIKIVVGVVKWILFLPLRMVKFAMKLVSPV